MKVVEELSNFAALIPDQACRGGRHHTMRKAFKKLRSEAKELENLLPSAYKADPYYSEDQASSETMAYPSDSKEVTIKSVNDEYVSPMEDSGSDELTPIQAQPKRNWRSYVWDTFDKSPEERRFLFKLDAAVLTFATLGYFIKYLDQINVNNAFVSGMKEDLNLYKNQLNYMQTCWTVGYVIGEIPCKSSCLELWRPPQLMMSYSQPDTHSRSSEYLDTYRKSTPGDYRTMYK
jgi:hypothetical protein